MRIIVAAAVALAVVPQDDVVKGWKHPWSGAAAGTRLKWKVAGDNLGQKFARERTETVKRIEGDSVFVDEQEGEEKNEQEYSLAPPSELEGTWKKTGDEEIKVGDRTFKCAVYESKKNNDLGVQTTRVWKSSDAPHWAVKATFSQIQNGMELLGWTEELLRIGEKTAAAGKDYTCRVVRKETRSPGIGLVETAWWTDELPGRAARKTVEKSAVGMKLETSVSELVEVQKK